jgi:heme-degrading monooxygenase HmoA
MIARQERLDQTRERRRLRKTTDRKSSTESQTVDGYWGGYALRDDRPDEVQFVVITFFDSFEAVKQFAGEDYTTPVFEPDAQQLLSGIETFATHYHVRAKAI